MPRSRKQTEPLRLGGHYMTVNGSVVAIDPATTDLPLRCKLALAEMATGQPHRVKPREEVRSYDIRTATGATGKQTD